MIDPDGIIVEKRNDNNLLTFNNIPEFEFLIYDFEEEKELNKFFKAVERAVRGSFEYRAMIRYLKDNMNMNQCSFIQVSNQDSYNVKIELHHYPFTLYDIVEIVFKKRTFYGERLDLYMVAKEVTMLHYKLLIGLIPLSTTVHQLVHDGKLFIPVQNVLGRYQMFIDFYKQFCTEEQLEVINRIEKYSIEQTSDLLNSSNILDQNHIAIEAKVDEYKLPDFNNLQDVMDTRISDIKKNNYKLPTLDEYKDLDKKDKEEDRRSVICPIYFSRKE